MTDSHPITLPPELIDQLANISPWKESIVEAYRAGANMELEACVEWMRGSLTPFMPDQAADQLRAARRPKSPRLAEQALKALHDQTCATAILMCLSSSEDNLKDVSIAQERVNTIRAALERLQELEKSND